MIDPRSTTTDPEIEQLIDKARAGSEPALADLFERYRRRLERMIEARMDRRLRGRIDPADVLQESYLHLSQKLDRYRQQDQLPFFLWLRLVTAECLIGLHRRHLGTAKRDAALEISLTGESMPLTDSYSIAAQLLGRITTASQKVMRAEGRAMLRNAIDSMEAIDREVLVLRHFEELDNVEVALILGIEQSSASSRYFRALKRLKAILDEVSG